MRKNQLPIYRGYTGSKTFDKTTELWHGEITNLPVFWREKVNIAKERSYSASDEKGLEIAFKTAVDIVMAIIAIEQEKWEGQEPKPKPQKNILKNTFLLV